jgi:hypothetical protein
MKIFCLIVCGLMAAIGAAKAQEVVTYPGPAAWVSNRYYEVTVNGKPVSVYDTPIASHAVFDFTGEVTVEIRTMYDVRWADIRPLSSGVKPHYHDAHRFSFILSKPQNLSIELNGRIRQQPLFLFSNAPETEKPDRNDPRVVWFEGGKLHENVLLELEDDQTVYIEGGAIVQGSIYARGKKNIRIMGRGLMDGAKNRERSGEHIRFIDFKDCQGITIQDIILQNATTWQIATFHSDQILIKNARIVSEYGGDDGIDLVRCTNVVVDGVFAHTKDDCIAIKSAGNYPPDHPTDQILVKNCVFWNSIWGNAIEIGFELYSDEVKNIRFENIDIIHVEDGAAISIHNAGPAHVHHIVFEDIRIEDCRQKLFDVAIFFSQWGPDGIRDRDFITQNYLHGAWDGVQKIPEGKEAYHRQYRGRVSQVTFRNIQVVDGQLPFSVFHGFDQEKNVSDVLIENLTFHGKLLRDFQSAKIRMENTRQVTIR